MKIQTDQIEFVPTLKPTLEQFKDFEKYVNNLFNDPQYLPYGCVKVIL